MSGEPTATPDFLPAAGLTARAARPRWLALVGVVWVMAFSVVLHSLIRFDLVKPADGPVLAKVTQAVGTVKYRTETSILWEDARTDQGLRRGDVVATGKDGHALVDFPGGRRFVLGPNSMVGIDEENDGNVSTGHLQLVLLKGQIAASMTQPRKPPLSPTAQAFESVMASLTAAQAEPKIIEPLSIQSGGQVFELQTRLESTLALSKTPNFPPRVIPASKVPPPPPPVAAKVSVASTQAGTPGAPVAPAKPAPLAILQMVPVLSREIVLPPVPEPVPAVMTIPKVAIKPVVIPARVLEMAPPPKTDPHTLDPLIVRVQKSVLITGVSLQSECASTKDLLIPIAPRFHLSPSTIWQPFIEFHPSGAKPFRMFGANQISRQFVKMPMEQICGPSAKSRVSGNFTVDMYPGHLASGDIEASMATDQPTRLTLASLADLPEKQVTVHFEKLMLGDGVLAKWLAFSSAKNQKIKIRLKSKAQLSALWRLFSGEGRVVLSNREASGPGVNVHFQDRSGWLATMNAPALDKADVRTLTKLLGAEMAYTGVRDGYVRLPLAIKARLNLIEDNLRTEGELYLLVRDRVVRVTMDDLKKDPQSIVTVGQSATAIFRKGTQPVLP